MRKISALTASAAYLLSFGMAYAQSLVPCVSGDLNCIDVPSAQKAGISARTPLNVIFGNIITIVFAVAALLVLGYLIYGAFKWITSGGDKEGAAGARKYIINALVGLAVLALAFVIVRVVGGIVNFDILNAVTFPALDASPRP